MKIRLAWAAGIVFAGLCVVGRMEVSAEDSSLSDKQTMEAKEQIALEPKVESVTQKETSEQSDAKQPEETAASAPTAEKTSEKTEVAAEEAKVSEPKAEVPKQEEAPKVEQPQPPTQEVADRTIEESLVMARAEADFFLQKLVDLVRRNEALGIEVLTDDQQAVNEKFVKLAGELNRSEKKKSALEESLKKMIEANDSLEKANDDAERRLAREKYQVALREASEILKGQFVSPVEPAGSLSDSVVLDIDGSGKIIVVNAGKFQGMKVGMKFYLVRVGEVIGECQVMEVREYLSAGLCKMREKEKSVELGDRLLPVVTK